MAELSRVAQAALRSTSRCNQAMPIFPSPSRHVVMKSAVAGRRHMATGLGVLSSTSRASRASRANQANHTNGTTSTVMPVTVSSRAQRWSSYNWANPTQPVQRDKRENYNPVDIELQRPSGSSYEFTFGRSMEKEREESEKKEFASDLSIDIHDISPDEKRDRTEAPIAPRPQMRLVPRTGRTIFVRNNVDVARSFKLLAIQVGQNRIRQQVSLQKYHERPGLKRKRVKSQRWIKRFGGGFRAAVMRVQELSKQGW